MSDQDLWKNFIVKMGGVLTQNQPNNADFKVYVPPFNSQAIPAGNIVDDRITNFAVHRVGDSLLREDSPLYTPGTDSYIDRLQKFLDCVQLNTDSAAGVQQVLEAKLDASTKATDDYYALRAKVDKIYTSSGGDKLGLTLEAWATDNYPPLTGARTTMVGANEAYLEVLRQKLGDDAAQRGRDRSKLDRALMNTPTENNMPVSKDPAPTSTGDAKTLTNLGYRPAYNIQSTYKGTIQDWINTSVDSNKPKWFLEFDNKTTEVQDWKKTGFSSINADVNHDYWLFFSATYKYNKETKTEKIDIAKMTDHIACKLEAQNASVFTISPDSSWDLGDVQSKYKKMKDGTPPDLMKPMYRIVSILVGYQVSLKITMPKTLYDSVKDEYNKATSHGGSCRLMGFDIGGSGTVKDTNSTDFGNVKTNDQTYTFEVPASNNTYPVLLGALGQRIGK